MCVCRRIGEEADKVPCSAPGQAEPAHAGGDAVMLCPISDPSESEKDPCPVCAVGGGTEVNVWRGPGVGSVMDPLFKALGHVSWNFPSSLDKMLLVLEIV